MFSWSLLKSQKNRENKFSNTKVLSMKREWKLAIHLKA